MSYAITARRPFTGLFNELVNLEDRFEPFFGVRKGSVPVEITSNEQAVVVKAEIPGVTKEDISVDYSQRVLTIVAEKKQTTEVTEGQVHYSEIRTGRQSRSIQLQAEIDFNRADATYVDGVLTITLPKVTASSESKLTIR